MSEYDVIEKIKSKLQAEIISNYEYLKKDLSNTEKQRISSRSYDCQCIYNFICMIEDKAFDKKFLEFMFHDTLIYKTCNTRELTRAILNLVETARIRFPKNNPED